MNKEDRLASLQMVFEHLRKHKLGMNPLKCFFGVSLKNLLRLVVWKEGVKLDTLKFKEILELKT